MGNHRFGLSDIIPNTWLYKLKYMAKLSRIQPHSVKKKLPTSIPLPPSLPRKSYYFSREILPSDTHPPPNSPKRKSPVKLSTASLSAGCSCRATLNSVWTKSDYPLVPDFTSRTFPAADSFGVVSWSSSCTCPFNAHPNHPFIDADTSPHHRKFDTTISELHLAPIITKPAKFNEMVKHIKKNETKERRRRSSSKLEEANVGKSESVKISHGRRFSTNSPGLRLRVNSPRIVNKKMQSRCRKSVSLSSNISDSLAIAKMSANPPRDFRDSMLEMIVENNIWASRDLEELLAAYLLLNLDEYHDLIIKVFKQIWVDLIHG